MENSGRLFGQIAAEAGCTTDTAKIGVYLMALSKQGKTISEASTLLKRGERTVKKYAREFMIDFTDYRPFGAIEKSGKERPAAKYELGN